MQKVIFNYSLSQFLLKLQEFNPKIDIPHIESIAINTIKYLNKGKIERKSLEYLQNLENQWYQSLLACNPDYSVYDSDYYFAELWACWVVYSKKYIQAIQANNSLFTKSICNEFITAKSIIDLGCGIGFTTGLLKELYPKAAIYGTNLNGTKQDEFNQMISKEFNFVSSADIDMLPKKSDLIIAFEYFEHFQEPVKHLLEILALMPKALLIANSFNSRAIGHFINYQIGFSQYSGKETSRIFNKTLREKGYKKVKTKLWNNRPTYWVKMEALQFNSFFK